MKRAQDLIYGVTGQSLAWIAPEGRPSSIVSSEVFPLATGDDDTAESSFTGSAAVDTNPNTTVRAASGAGQSDPTALAITDDTGVSVGGLYLVTDAEGRPEWVDVVGVDDTSAAEIAYSRLPLLNSYESGGAFVSTRITHSLADAWIQDENNVSDDPDPATGWRWRLEYVVDSETHVHDIYFDVVRYPGKTAVNGVDMDHLYPGWINTLPTDYRDNQGQTLLSEAYGEVMEDLYANGIADEMIRSEMRDRGVRKKAMAVKYLSNFYSSPTAENADRREMADREYAAWLERLITVSSRLPQSTGAEGSGHIVKPQNLWRR